jgi:hypothetical protein
MRHDFGVFSCSIANIIADVSGIMAKDSFYRQGRRLSAVSGHCKSFSGHGSSFSDNGTHIFKYTRNVLLDNVKALST